MSATDPPYLVNGWQPSLLPTTHSPFRIQYGINNPAMRGVVITQTSVVPNFSWTPRLALESADLDEILSHPDWQGSDGGPPGVGVAS